MQRGRSPVSLSDLLRAGLLHPGDEIRLRRGDTSKATVTERSTILLGETEYTSPSTAAKAATGTATNGWLAWYVRRGEEWTDLAALRKHLLPPDLTDQGDVESMS